MVGCQGYRCDISLPTPLFQHIDKVFKHKELQQQLMDAKLQRITEMMREVEDKQQRERDFVSTSATYLSSPESLC